MQKSIEDFPEHCYFGGLERRLSFNRSLSVEVFNVVAVGVVMVFAVAALKVRV